MMEGIAVKNKLEGTFKIGIRPLLSNITWKGLLK